MRKTDELFCGKKSDNRTFFLVITALILIYVLSMTFAFPTMVAVAEASDAKIEVYSPKNNSTSNESNNVEPSSFGCTAEEDCYKNKWEQTSEELYVIREDETKRTQNEKHFLMSDGSYTMISYPMDVHYIQDGEYVEIDNTLIEKNGKLINKSNALVVELPELYSKNSKTVVSVGDYKITFKLKGFLNEKGQKAQIKNINTPYVIGDKNYICNIKNQSKIKYQFDNNAAVELEQVIIGTQFKENIIVKEKLQNYEFEFEIKTKDLFLELDDKGNILANAASENTVLLIPKGYMFDACGNSSENVTYELVRHGANYSLKICADKDWINEESRVFPVTIDPTIEISENSTFISASRDVVIDNLLPVNNETESFIDFEVPDSILNSTVIYAQLRITAKNQLASNYLLSMWSNNINFTAGNAPAKSQYQVPNPLNPSEITETYLCYFDDKEQGYKPDQQIVIVSQNMTNYYLNITRGIKNAVDFNRINKFYGFAFTSDSSNTIYIADEQHPNVNYRPFVEINYRNIVGLESYWDYDQYSIGRNNVYINKYNDALTLIHDDVSLASDLPINLQHVFLSSYDDGIYDVDGIFTNVNYGNGWKLNYQQIIRNRNGDFEYYDADGTMHYMKYNSDKGYCEDEDGLGLILYRYNGTAHIMRDINKTESYFDAHGRLFKIEDANGNIINIKYGNGNQNDISQIPITEINDNSGRVIYLFYNESGQLSNLKYYRADGTTQGSTIFTYDDSGNLTNILNDDGTYTNYTYSSDGLNTVSIESGYTLRFVTDEVYAADDGILIPAALIENYTSKIRSVSDSVDGITWRHIKDNIYADGITISVQSEIGEEYVPYRSYREFSDYVVGVLNEASKDVEVILFYLATLGLGYVLMLMLFLTASVPLFVEESMPYLESNFRIKQIYDSYGRLISSYIDSDKMVTSLDLQYEQSNNGEFNINNNKIKATSSYTSSIINELDNGSFEENNDSWTLGVSGGNPYRNASISNVKTVHGKNALEMYIAQPYDGEYITTQSVTLSPGRYALSGYVGVRGLLIPNEANGDFGAKLRVRNYADSEYVNADVYSVNSGFKYVEIIFEMDTETVINVDLVLANCSGFVYFDAIQLTQIEYGVDATYNNAVNSGFEKWSGNLPTGWSLWTDAGVSVEQAIEKISGEDTLSGDFGVRMKGSLLGSINLYQTVPIPVSSQSVAYTVSAWINDLGAVYLPLAESRLLLNYRVSDANGNYLIGFVGTDINLPFAAWHQVSATFIAPPGAAYVEINLQIWGSTSELLIDNISLVQSQIINLEYNDKGVNTSYSDGTTEYTYDENGNSIAIGKDGEEEYGVVKDDNGNVISSTDFGRNVKTEYTYDLKGRVTSETFSSVNGSQQIASQIDYATVENNLYEIVTNTDSLGFETISKSYLYSELLERTTMNDGSYIEYVYGGDDVNQTGFPSAIKTITINNKDSANNILSSVEYEYFTISDAVISDDYGYRHVGALKKVELSSGTVYSYVYDAWGNIVETRLNGVKQSSSVYNNTDGTLISKTLGDNGYSEYYYYDALGRMIEFRAVGTYVTDALSVNDSDLLKHVYYEYDLKGRTLSVKDTVNDKGYWYNYDANGRIVLSGEGYYGASDGEGSIDTTLLFEVIYDRNGDIYAENVIEFANEWSTYGIEPQTYSLTGTFGRNYPTAGEKIFVGGELKVNYRLNQNGYSLREDNSFYGKTIHYKWNEFGKIESFVVGAYATDGSVTGTSYLPFYTFHTARYDYDAADGNLWDAEWAILNQNPDSGTKAVKVDDVTVNGTEIKNIIRFKQESFYSSAHGYYSLVEPELLKLGGDSVELQYTIRRVTPNAASPEVAGLRFRYTDGTSSSFAYIPMDSDWHTYTLTCENGKTVAAIELPWYYDATLELGNVILTAQSVGKIDSRYSGINLQDGNYVSYEYDDLGRLTSATVKNGESNAEIFGESYGYIDGTGNATSYTVEEITVSRGDTVLANYGYIYNMHADGTLDVTAPNPYNIYKITENGVVKAEFFYDGLGRLSRENNAYTNQTVTYTYDSNNNILSKTTYTYTPGNGTLSGGTVTTYTYGDSVFKDRLTAYNGQSIIYDNGASNGIGLPTTYLGKTMAWEGRELVSVVYGGDSIAYSYDLNGLRLSKSVNGTVTEYLYSGTRLLRQTTGDNVIWFIYDQDGMVGFELNGTPYYYLRNLLSDVAGIIDSNGNVVVNYTYDSWGKLISVTGSQADTVGALNPIRYRGYYYDAETGFYYLNSRYYDAETGRFISPDVFAENGNQYVYCVNDPINFCDPSGYASMWNKIKNWFDSVGAKIKKGLDYIGEKIKGAVGAVSIAVIETFMPTENLLYRFEYSTQIAQSASSELDKLVTFFATKGQGTTLKNYNVGVGFDFGNVGIDFSLGAHLGINLGINVGDARYELSLGILELGFATGTGANFGKKSVEASEGFYFRPIVLVPALNALWAMGSGLAAQYA